MTASDVMKDVTGELMTGADLTQRAARGVARLRELEGQEIGVSDWLEMTLERIRTYADATGDFQAAHQDPDHAKQSRFGGPVVQGFLTLALIPAMVAESGQLAGIEAREIVNYGANRVRFISPVRVGSRIRLRSRLLKVESVSEGVWQLTKQNTMEIEGSDRPAMVAETLSRIYT